MLGQHGGSWHVSSSCSRAGDVAEAVEGLVMVAVGVLLCDGLVALSYRGAGGAVAARVCALVCAGYSLRGHAKGSRLMEGKQL